MPSIGSLPARPQAPGHKINAEAPPEAEKTRGKSAESPAHRARAALSEAALGHSAPNLFGKVTSGLAHGITLAAVLALQTETPPVDPAPTAPGEGAEAPAETQPPETTPAV